MHAKSRVLAIGLFAALFFSPATMAAAPEPFAVGPGSKVCVGNVEHTSVSDSDKADAIVLGFKRAKATAVGRFGTEHNATAEAGIRFRPLIHFEASITVTPQYNGTLSGGGPSITNWASFRIDVILRDLTADAVLASEKIDEVKEPSGATGVVHDLFDPKSGTVSATFSPDHEYELVLRLRVRAKGLGTEAQFSTELKGASYECLSFETALSDSDGDGIYDVWEQVGIDVDGDGGPDLQPDDLGTDYRGEAIVLDPDKKDILVEIDYFDCAVDGGDCDQGDTHSHRPLDGALDRVREAFAAAPVTNPDGDGINLWMVRDQALSHRRICNLDPSCFDALKPDNFGAGDGEDALKTAARRLIFHYSLWAHRQGDPQADVTTLGLSELPGNDSLITLGGWTNDSGTVQEQSLTLMHELGHNLGLDHGGSDSINCKPNYLSIMSYTWDGTGLITVPGELDGILDYSRGVLPSSGEIDELGPDEGVGIEDGDFITYYGPPADLDGIPPLDWRVGMGMGPIDWDADGIADEPEGDKTDLNYLDIPGCGPSPGQTLHGHDDWPNLVYNFRGTDNFLVGIHDVAPEDFDFETAQRIRERIWWSGVKRLHEYSGKLICGVQADVGDFGFTRGGYATSINVHNPNRAAVTFFHKLALARPDRDQVEQRIYPLGFARLAYDEAYQVDCNLIQEKLFPKGLPEGFIEGYLVVQSPKSLDASGVYTTAALDADDRPLRQSSIDVERIAERVTRLGRADLVISALDLNVTCDPPAACLVNANAEVSNIGDEAAGPFQVSLRLRPGGKTIKAIDFAEGLAAGETKSETLAGSFEPDEAPDATGLCVAADLPADVVPERNEHNNESCVGVSLP